MRNYLFIPYNPEEAEIFKAVDSSALKAKWLRLARQSTAKCSLFAFDTRKSNGLRLLYSVRDGEINDADGREVGKLAGQFF